MGLLQEPFEGVVERVLYTGRYWQPRRVISALQQCR